jgi:hypothetical protein
VERTGGDDEEAGDEDDDFDNLLFINPFESATQGELPHYCAAAIDRPGLIIGDFEVEEDDEQDYLTAPNPFGGGGKSGYPSCEQMDVEAGTSTAHLNINDGGGPLVCSTRSKPGNPNPGAARKPDAVRLAELADEFEQDLLLRCGTGPPQSRTQYTSECAHGGKCRIFLCAAAFDYDTQKMSDAAAKERRKPKKKSRCYQDVLHGGMHRSVRHMLLYSTEVCLSTFAWFKGYAPGMVTNCREHVDSKTVPVDLRSVAGAMPKLTVQPTIRKQVEKWMLEWVPKYAQNPPVPLNAKGVEEQGSRSDEHLVLGTMSVRGGLFTDYMADRQTSPTKYPMLQRGYFAKIFYWTFSKEYQHQHGNPVVLNKMVSSTGYCKICTKNAELISSDDHLEKTRGLQLQGQHRKVVLRQRQGYQSNKDRAEEGNVVSVGYDAAGLHAFQAPILKYVETVLIGNPRVQFKVMGVMHHWRDGVERSRNYVMCPQWVQATANLQSTMLVFVTLPAIIEDFNNRRMAVPQTLCLQHDGGGDVDNQTHYALCVWLVQQGAFECINDTRVGAGHSHDDYDWSFMMLLRWLRKFPGYGGMTPELLKDHISKLDDSTVDYIDRCLDFKLYFKGCIFKELKHARESLGKRFRLIDGSVDVEMCTDPTAPDAEWICVGRGETGTAESFFVKDPVGSPEVAPCWNDDPAAAISAVSKFKSAIVNVVKKVGELSGATLSRYGVRGDTSDEQRSTTQRAWQQHGIEAPQANGQPSEPSLSLVWPPPFLKLLQENRSQYKGGRAPTHATLAPPAADVVLEPQRKRQRTTSRVDSVQKKTDILKAASARVEQPETVTIGNYYIAVDENCGNLLWVVQVVSIHPPTGRRVAGSMAPSLLGHQEHWRRSEHCSKCKWHGSSKVWHIDDDCSVASCPRAGTCNVKWYAPSDVDLTGVDEAVSVAIEFAKGNSEFIAPYLTSHFQTRADSPVSKITMDCIGPKVDIHTSKQTKNKVKLKAGSKRDYIATAAQLCRVNHPGFLLP